MNSAATSATWTADRVRQLHKGITAGLTCAEIAAEIGVTRNAVIGKISRLGLSTGRRPGEVPARMRAARAQRPRQRSRMADVLRTLFSAQPTISVATVETPPIESAPRRALLDLSAGGCRWPLGDPAEAGFGFCGNDAIARFSYCAGHMRIAYRLPYGRCA
jgi:GcrA cell cycle regulator